MNHDGTVTERLFINQPGEKDHQAHLLNRLKIKQKQGGRYAKNKGLWAKINGLNDHIVNDTVHQIVEFVKETGVQVVVFEYLNFKGKKPRNVAAKLNLWAKREIQRKVEGRVHALGVRFRRVSPINTSALAFDGSGLVTRDKNNHSLCIFTTGKHYHNDLNATYNIGARFFLNELEKTTPIKEWADVMAKVPDIGARTRRTLFMLRQVVAVLS